MDDRSGVPARDRLLAGPLAIFGLGTAATLLWAGLWPTPPWVPAAIVVAMAVLALGMGLLAGGGRVRWPGAISDEGHQRPAGRTDATAGMKEPLGRLQVEVRGRTRVVPISEIEWIEAEGNYVRLHFDGDAFLYRMSLGRLIRALPDRFLRIHKSAAVNLDALTLIDPIPNGDAVVRLASGAQVRASRRYATALHSATGRPR